MVFPHMNAFLNTRKIFFHGVCGYYCGSLCPGFLGFLPLDGWMVIVFHPCRVSSLAISSFFPIVFKRWFISHVFPILSALGCFLLSLQLSPCRKSPGCVESLTLAQWCCCSPAEPSSYLPLKMECSAHPPAQPPPCGGEFFPCVALFPKCES